MMGVWIKSSNDEVVEAGDMRDVPVGHNALDAYRLGWVGVTFGPGIPTVEGTERSIRAVSPLLTNILQERYGVETVYQGRGFGWRLAFQAMVNSFDERGRPRGSGFVDLEDILVARLPRPRGFAGRRPGVHVGRHRRRA